jgi:regulatory protein YycH of two-component signal transduction system YycFG
MEKRIENIKSVALVVLFLSTMLLLYFFWQNPSMGSFRLPAIIADDDDSVVVLSVRDVTWPQETGIHFGSGVYTVAPHSKHNAFQQTLDALAAIGTDENLAVEEITAEQYRQIMEFRSLWFSFSYNIPFASFCDEYGILRTQSLDGIETVTRIAYSVGSPESVFVYDGKNNKYYRLVAREEQPPLSQVIDQIESDGYDAYYTIGSLAGTTNQVIIPLVLEASYGSLPFQKEFREDTELETRAFAQTFFGVSFDFVRRIEESKGSVIYMYGYGEKILTISVNGQVEYKERDSGANSGQQDYFSALSKALQFIGTHGGFVNEGDAGISPYVASAIAVERNRERGYRFTFGAEINGIPTFLKDGDLIMVEVMGDRITYYSRNMIRMEPDRVVEALSQPPREVFSALNMIAQNYKLIQQALLRQNLLEEGIPEEEIFEVVADLITDIQTGLVEIAVKDEENRLVPAWIVTAGNERMYFDLYEAFPLDGDSEGR